MRADVAVIGLGAVGSMALWQLARRGVDVVGFDTATPPHTLGSTHGSSRIFRLSAMEGAWYVPLVERAAENWAELSGESGTPLLHPTGFLQLDVQGGDLRRVALDGLRARGLAVTELTAAEVRERFPAHRIGDDEAGIFDPRGGWISPEDAVSAALHVAQERGATLRCDTKVLGGRASSGGAVVRTDAEEWEVRHVVNATGGWLPELVPAMNGHISVERQAQVWLRLGEPELFTPERFPVFIRNGRNGREHYGFPSTDGVSVKLAGHHGGVITAHPDGINRTVAADDADVVIEFAGRDLRGVSADVTRVAVCFYPSAPDREFAIGSPPGMEWCTVVGAASGHGFKFASVLGEIAADLATDGATHHEIGQFAISRLTG